MTIIMLGTGSNRDQVMLACGVNEFGVRRPKVFKNQRSIQPFYSLRNSWFEFLIILWKR